MKRVLRVVGWNLLFTLAGLLLIALAGEAYFRLTVPFADPYYGSWRFIPGVGVLYEPNAEVRFTNNLDFWTVQRTNSLGFLDREPIEPSRVAESCHVTFIGDSFVDAREVDISDKLQVRLEEFAGHGAPHLNVTTSAFAFRCTGQVNQLPFYDIYARGMNPDMVVLVFVGNDITDSLALSDALQYGYDPYHMPHVYAYRGAGDLMAMRLPDPDHSEHELLAHSEIGRPSTVWLSWVQSVSGYLSGSSYLARWLNAKYKHLSRVYDAGRPDLIARARHLMGRPEYAHLFEAQETPDAFLRKFTQIDSGIESAIWREAWDATEFGLEQFKRRADHDGAALMILAVYHVGVPVFDRLSTVASSLGIPVINQHDYIVRQGGNVGDARFRNDRHWTPAGHQWAAETVWEHMKTEWNGECPSAVPQPDIEVGWISTGRRFHTPDGVAFVDSFPALNPEGYESVYRSVVSSSPIARLDWNVHLYKEGLTYVKEPCTADDINNRFFLHVVPKDKSDMPEHPSNRDFDNLDFYFGIRGAMFEGLCMVSVDLPEYEIASIRTGQFVRGEGEVWEASIEFEE